jgi:hypothetical protein
VDSVSDWVPPGYVSREEWLEDRREAALAAMSMRQRLSRWWWIYWPAVVMLVLLGLGLPVLVYIAGGLAGYW